jgi:hypothetical protein
VVFYAPNEAKKYSVNVIIHIYFRRFLTIFDKKIGDFGKKWRLRQKIGDFGKKLRFRQKMKILPKNGDFAKKICDWGKKICNYRDLTM